MKCSAIKVNAPKVQHKNSLKRGCCDIRWYSEWQQKIKGRFWVFYCHFLALPVISGCTFGKLDSIYRETPAQTDAAKQNKTKSEPFHASAYLYEWDEVSRPNTVVVPDQGQGRKLFLNAFACELVDVLWQPPLPLPPVSSQLRHNMDAPSYETADAERGPRPSRSCQTRRGENSGGRLTQGYSPSSLSVPNRTTRWMPQARRSLRELWSLGYNHVTPYRGFGLARRRAAQKRWRL
jgi:hypothetical protein